MLKNLTAVCLAVCLTLCFTLSVQAQPLADRVPDDALVYVGWRGADDPGDGYAGSNLQALGGSEELAHSLSQALDLIQRANPDNPWATMVTDLVRSLGSSTWHLPTAVYLQPVDNPDMPVRLTVAWQAQGEQGDALINALQNLIQQLPPDAPVKVDAGEPLVTLTIGIPEAAQGEAAGQAAPVSALADSPAFKQVMAQVQPDGVLVVYANAKGLLSLFDRLAQHSHAPNASEQWTKVRDALGLDGLESLAFTGGFDGPDWRSDLFIAAPAPQTGPRQGILALFNSDPITDDTLAQIPAEATSLAVTQLDPGKLLDEIKRIATAIDPATGEKINEAFTKVDEMTGVDVDGDLIRAFGSTWVFYTDPGATGDGMLSFCVVNTPKDPDAVNRSLTSLQAVANAFMGQAGAQAGMRIRFQTSQYQGMTMNTLGIPFVAPTWAVHDGKLYLALYPQTVMTAFDRAAADGPSILESEAFQAARERLGVDQPTSISYTDLPRTARSAYQSWVMISQIGSGALAMFGGDNPVLLPPYAKIEPLLSPAIQATWADDAGFHFKAISPFPGASLLGPQSSTNMSTMTTPLMVGTMLPALGAARRAARQMKSTTQCRGIVQSRITAAQDNHGHLPDDIADMVEQNYFSIDYVISPRSPVHIPPDFHQWDMQQQKQWIRKNASYILIPGLKDDINSETVCVFERPDGRGDGIAVGFNDGSARFMENPWEVRQLIEAQTDKTIEELIQHQENYQPPAE